MQRPMATWYVGFELSFSCAFVFHGLVAVIVFFLGVPVVLVVLVLFFHLLFPEHVVHVVTWFHGFVSHPVHGAAGFCTELLAVCKRHPWLLSAHHVVFLFQCFDRSSMFYHHQCFLPTQRFGLNIH